MFDCTKKTKKSVRQCENVFKQKSRMKKKRIKIELSLFVTKEKGH